MQCICMNFRNFVCVHFFVVFRIFSIKRLYLTRFEERFDLAVDSHVYYILFVVVLCTYIIVFY